MLYDNVTSVLTGAYYDKTRIRIFYGDTQTGIDNLEYSEIIGYVKIVNCKGKKVFALFPYKNSKCGLPILSNKVIKITINCKTVYQTPNYQTPEFYIQESTVNGKPWFYLFKKIDNVPYYGNAKRENCVNEIAFFLGKTNKHKWN